MGRADRHVGHGDFILGLTDHDAQIPRVSRHPVQYAGGRAHGIGGVELDPRRGAPHGQGIVPGPERQGFRAGGKGFRQGIEIRRRIVVAGARRGDVLGHHRVALAAELQFQRLLQNLEVEPQQVGDDTEGDGVLDDLVAASVRQFPDGHGTEAHPFRRFSRLDPGTVVDHPASGAQQPQMPVHGVLVQAQQHVEAVSMTEYPLIAHAHGEENVPAPDDGLIGVIGVQPQAAARKEPRQDAAGGLRYPAPPPHRWRVKTRTALNS